MMAHFIGDAHIYATHIEGVRFMLARAHLPQPVLGLGDTPTLASVVESPGIFQRLEPDQATVVGYRHQGRIDFAMRA